MGLHHTNEYIHHGSLKRGRQPEKDTKLPKEIYWKVLNLGKEMDIQNHEAQRSPIGWN